MENLIILIVGAVLMSFPLTALYFTYKPQKTKAKPRNKNLYVDYEFVKRIISSCTERKHIKDAVRLVALFDKRHRDSVFYESLDELLRRICIKINY